MCSFVVNFWYTNSVSVRRVCRSRQRRKFVQMNCVYGSSIKTVHTFRCSSHSTAKPTQKSHLTDSGWPRKLVVTLIISQKLDLVQQAQLLTITQLMSMRFQHQKIFNSELNCCLTHPQNSRKTYLFYGTVYLMKNIRNM